MSRVEDAPQPPPGRAAEAEPAEVVVARFGELWLKGRNRREFESRLAANTRVALAPIAPMPPGRIDRERGQFVVRLGRRGARVREVAQRLCEVFGFSSVSPARRTPADPDAIAAAACALLGPALDRLGPGHGGAKIPFRVETRRADKRFPMVSTELDRYVADRLPPECTSRLRVDLSEPALTVGISVRPGCAYVFAERLPGAGGLPVGTLGRVVCLLSGGIDSPVAAWMAMKRGCETVYATFHSYPYIGQSFQAKVHRLARQLARYQNRSVVYQVPFARIQEAIRDRAPEAYRTVLYRRAMQRIGTRIAHREKASALVTGESLGQVASQTLENLTCIEEASGLPVLRPLVSFDKQETIALARRIGTYAISVEREPDCCTVFQPRKPIIRGRLAVCHDAEAALDVEGLTTEAVDGAERVTIEA